MANQYTPKGLLLSPKERKRRHSLIAHRTRYLPKVIFCKSCNAFFPRKEYNGHSCLKAE